MNFFKVLFVILQFGVFSSAFAQSTCANSAPFCANQGAVSFPAGVNNGSAAAGPDYGCLGSQPNPAWYYFQVSQSGSIIIDIAGSGGSDVDFICWGPFSSPTGNCNNLVAGNTVDCSFSASATETCTINGAIVGEYYTLLLTNFSNQPQNINFSQSTGSGATNCGLLSSGVTSQTVCPGVTATLTANSNIINPTYVWTPGGATTPSIVVSPGATTVYSVSISGTNPATSTATTIVNSGTVTINTSPTPTPTSNSPLCPGATLSLSVNSSSSYAWSGPAGFSSTLQSPTVTNVSSASAGVYSVTVTNSFGCSGTGTVNVSLGSAASPTLGSNSPICSGSTLSLTATNGATSYTWTGPGGFNSTQQNPVIPSVTSSGVYTLTTAGVLCLSINTISVTVVPVSSSTLSSNSPVCSGSTLSLTATGSATTYTWTGPGGFTSNLQNPTVSNFTTSGVYTLTTGAALCLTTNTISVTAIPLTTTTLSSNSPICAGGTLSLTATGSATTFTWTGPGGFTSNFQNPTINSISTSGIYTLTTGSGVCLTINTISITVIPSVPVSLSPIPVVCNNGNINLTGPSGGTTYSWTGPSSFTSSVQNPVINNASVVNQGVYSLSVTTGACLNTGTVSVSVYNILSFAPAPSPIVLCEGKTGTLSANGLGGSGSYNFAWTPTFNLTSPNSATTAVTGSVTTDYTLTVSDANCPVTNVASASVLVTVNPKPQITMSTSDARGCEPFCTDLISSSVPASASCIWKFSNNTGSSSCNTSIFCFPIHGTYSASLTVTDINGCVDSVNQNAFVIVDPKPFADFEWVPTNPTILVNEVNFTDLSTVGAPMQSWDWSFGDYYLPYAQDTSSFQNPTHLYNNVGNYTVTLAVTNSFGCVDSVSKIVVIEDEFALYIPNAFSPSREDTRNDVFNVQGMGFLADSFEMAIYDRWGHLVFKTDDVYKGWDGSVKGGAKAQQGVYVYKIKLKDFKLRDRSFIGHITLL